MASDTTIPDVTQTDIDRDDLVDAANELGIDDYESLGDQELLEEVGRRLGALEEDQGSSDTEDGGGDGGADSPVTGDLEQLRDQLQDELSGMTRDEVRHELRSLGLPVSGAKDELVQRLVAARVGETQAQPNGQGSAPDSRAQDAASRVAGAARQTGEQAGDTAQRAGQQAGETAQQAGEQATDTAQQAGEQAGETAQQAGDTAQQAGEQATEGAQQTGEQATDAAQQAAPTSSSDDEYRVEDDEREQIQPVLDLELGPIAVDLLGLDVHLNRVHAVVVANPEPKHALLGKTLASVGTATEKLGVNKLLSKLTDGVEKLTDVLPTPDTGGDTSGDEAEAAGADGEDSGGEDDSGGGGLLRRASSAAGAAARSAKNVFRHGADAAGSSKDAAVDAATPGDNLQAAKEAKDAAGSAKDAAGSAKNAVTGGE